MKKVFVLMLSFSLLGCHANHLGQSNSSKPSEKMQSDCPHDVNQATEWLLEKMTRKQIEDVKSKQVANMVDYHFTIGLWVRNNWLVKSSNLRLYFNGQGIYDRDAMVGIILTSLWRSIHGVPINADEQIDEYKKNIKI